MKRASDLGVGFKPQDFIIPDLWIFTLLNNINDRYFRVKEMHLLSGENLQQSLLFVKSYLTMWSVR